MSQSESNKRAALRQRLTNEITATGFDAFCLDYFERVYRQFTRGMDRAARINLLLESVADDAAVSSAFDTFLRTYPTRRHWTQWAWKGALALAIIVSLTLGVHALLKSTGAPKVSAPQPAASPPAIVTPVPSAPAPPATTIHVEIKDHATGQVIGSGGHGVQNINGGR